MKELIDVGLTTFDGADIYGKLIKIYEWISNKIFILIQLGPAEDYMGEVNAQQAEKKAQFMTKFVPRPGSMTREVRSLQFSFFGHFIVLLALLTIYISI